MIMLWRLATGRCFLPRRTGLVLAALLAGMAVVGPAATQPLAERLPTCLACHGEKGQSETPETPSLGGQQPAYTVIELYMFREKLRIAPPMNDMVEGLADADLQALADTLAKLPPPPPAPGPTDSARITRARALVSGNRCDFCHSADFAGNDSVPRIGGQREDYLLKTLGEYKSGARKEYQQVMREVVAPLSDADLADLAYYLAHAPMP